MHEDPPIARSEHSGAGNAPGAPEDRTRQLLSRMDSGDEAAAAELLDALYGDLRGLAGKYMSAERTGHTLQPTALVHEAWMRVAGSSGEFNDRAHFVRTASRAMRRILVDHARARKAQKRGQGEVQNGLDEMIAGYESERIDVIELDDVLARLVEVDPELGQLVELRFFGGQSLPEIAKLVGVSQTTIERRWRIARAWLRDEMDPIE